jgi:serine/threonine protein kinase
MASSLTGQTLLNQYYIEEFITLTALGELYRATDIRNNSSFALTLLPKSISENAESLKELETHSLKLRDISQSNIASYLGIYQTPTDAFLIEVWTDGPSLQEVLKLSPISVNEVLIYVKTICSALEALHRKNYLHLHLSPELIHIDKKGQIIISGIAAAIPAGKTAAAKIKKHQLLYISPEQFNGEILSTAADIYSLAVIIYQLVTGVWINGKSAPKTDETIRKVHLETIPPAPISINKKLPDHFSRMILWALRKKPEDRLRTTTELISSCISRAIFSG